ncbi:META domain-containing protein [Aquimarina longa]|uniref:META domain-containing protein n=1 Tax=Aquimarina longa TaxID=1080221 RepID=UPI000781DEA1|nr:META domain-containing protein [Aquimarina longa]
MKSLIIILSSLILSITTTCGDKKNKTKKNQLTENQFTEEVKFFITTLHKENIEKEKLYIIFNKDDNSASGFSGCNQFSSKYTIEKETISFASPMYTKMYCEKTAMLEKKFISTLTKSKIRVVKGDSLFLKDNNNTILLSGVQSKN